MYNRKYIFILDSLTYLTYHLNTDITKLVPQEGSVDTKKAKTLSSYLNNVGLLLGLWLLIYPYPYEILITISLLYPFAALFLYYKYKGIITLEDDSKSKVDPKHPTLLSALVMPALGVTFRMLSDYEPVSYANCLWPIILIFIVLVLIVLLIQRPLSYKVKLWSKINVNVLLFIIPFSYGSCIAINCLYDQSAPKIYRATVLNKRSSHGKRTTYYLKLDKWGTRNEPEDVSVSESRFNATSIDQVMHVNVKKGALGIPWFYVEP